MLHTPGYFILYTISGKMFEGERTNHRQAHRASFSFPNTGGKAVSSITLTADAHSLRRVSCKAFNISCISFGECVMIAEKGVQVNLQERIGPIGPIGPNYWEEMKIGGAIMG